MTQRTPTAPDRRRRYAAVGITIQFLALVRNLGEVFRLRYLRGADVPLPVVLPYVTGALLTAVCCWLAVTLFFFRRYTATLIVAAGTVSLLVSYKLFWFV